MQYLPTAFAQLVFAWKLYHYGLKRRIDRRSLDIPITFKDVGMVLVLPDQIFESDDDLIIALENNLVVAFGAAAITLNRSREQAGHALPQQMTSENDQCICLIYQIRNAFAHDIAEPKWEIRNPVFQQVYEFGGIRVDLSNVDGNRFDYADIGGPDVLFRIKEYAEEHLWRPPNSL